MQKHGEQHLKIDVNSTNISNNNGQTPSTSDGPRESQQHQMMPPPSAEWNNQYNSPEAEDMGPFVEQLLPFVRASAYNWFHLQAAKRRHFKDFDKRMSAIEENNKLAELELQNDREELKVKWTSRLLGKIKKDISNDYKDAFVAAITGIDPHKCAVSVADHKGKMRRIDCLRQADKVWRLDLVTVILFKGIPLESTDGERLERCDSCVDPLCINPFHIAISVRGLDIFMASYLKDVDKMPIHYRSKDISPEITRLIKEEPGESSIATPHAVLGTSSTHARVWESPPIDSDDVIVTYDLQKACHSYFSGRTSMVQQSVSDPYSHLESNFAVDNNYYDPKRSVLCLPPPPLQGCLSYNGSDSQPLDMSEDSNDGPVEKRRRDTPTHDSPNSSFCSTNDEVRRIVENGNSNKLVLGQSSSIWIPSTQYGRQQQHTNGPGPIRQIRSQVTDFRNQELTQNTAFRTTKPVRRMTVNAGNHGDVGVVVVDERNIQNTNIHAQTIASALNSLRTTPTMLESPAGRKRIHHSTGSPFELLGNCSQDMLKNIMSGSDVSPPHAVVTNLISRESSGFIASPTKFTTARGDTTSFRNLKDPILIIHFSLPIGIRVHSPDSPGSSNEGAANQAPVLDVPKDPNAPKLPTDFSQALLDEKS
uniref:CTF/NF-I domain-containing protein n=1 Tax=Caenorhabditis tropicalis TaxID=1561998 RepID=A0A1I7U5F5_9PELO